MSKQYLLCCLPFLAILLTNCAPTLELRSVEMPPTIRTKSIKIEGTDAAYTLKGKAYRFPGIVKNVQ